MWPRAGAGNGALPPIRRRLERFDALFGSPAPN